MQLRDTLATQKENLNELLGRDLDTPFRTEQVPGVTPEEMDMKVARQTALAQRPEVKEAEIDVNRANYDRRLSKAKYIPDVGAALHYLEPINTAILPQNILSAGVELKWDPFDWGGRRDEVAGKDVSVQQSHYQLEETKAQVMLDVDNNFRKLQESRSLLEVAQASRDAANREVAGSRQSIQAFGGVDARRAATGGGGFQRRPRITNKACFPSGMQRLPLRKPWGKSEAYESHSRTLARRAGSSAAGRDRLQAAECRQRHCRCRYRRRW